MINYSSVASWIATLTFIVVISVHGQPDESVNCWTDLSCESLLTEAIVNRSECCTLEGAASYSTFDDTCSACKAVIVESPREVFEGETNQFCISLLTVLQNETVEVDIRLNFIDIDRGEVVIVPEVPNTLILTSANPRECYNISIPERPVDINRPREEIEINISPTQQDVIEIRQSTITVLIPSFIIVTTPRSQLSVSEGIPAVVCFITLFEGIEDLDITLVIETIDISTSSNDYRHGPFFVRLLSFEPQNCLRIPTFNNNDGNNDTESFLIDVGVDLAGSSHRVGIDQSSIVVTLFETCVDGDVRLLNGNNSGQGRVEVCLNGVFGSLCDTGRWTDSDARVVCRQLGFRLVVGFDFPPEAIVPNNFGRGSGPIVAGRFDCNGFEINPLNCSIRQFIGPQVCTPDVGVECHLLFQQECIDGSLRLVGSDDPTQGRVEICHNNVWGTVCENSWNDIDAAVVCRQLNFTAIGSTHVAVTDGRFGPGIGPIWLNEVQCTGQEQTLFNCSQQPFGINNCNHDQDVGVICNALRPPIIVSEPPCTNGSLRLSGSENSTEGRVEICYNNVWGTICDTLWDDQDAAVVCRQLNISSVLEISPLAVNGGTFGPGVGPIWLDEVQCTGQEEVITACNSEPFGSRNNCQHSEDAGVICIPQIATPSPANGTCGPGQFSCITKPGRCFDESYRCDGIPDCIGDNNVILDETECPESICTHGEVRPLVGGASPKEGFIEVCAEGLYLPVSSLSFTIKEANVLCQQLNLGSAGFPLSATKDLGIDSEFFINSLPSEGIVLAEIFCNGNESNISMCNVTARDFTREFIFIPRGGQEVINLIDFAAVQCIEAVQCRDGELRLMSQPLTDREGRVEICYQGVWGAVYDLEWSAIDAAVVCQQLNFASKGALPFLSAVYPSDPRVLPVVYDCPICRTIQNTSLLDCPRTFIEEDDESFIPLGVLVNGGHVGITALKGIVGVSCEDYLDSGCEDFEVRLTYRESRSVGNLEICVGDQWNSVCNEFFRDNELTVVCRALGFSDFEDLIEEHRFRSTENAFISIESGPILMQDITCSGNESSLTACGNNVTVHQCEHFMDVRVQCLARPEILLDPPVPSGSLFVDEGRPVRLECSVSTFMSYPLINSFTAITPQDEVPFIPPPRNGKRDTVSVEDFQNRLLFGDIATQNDSGVYSCLATSGFSRLDSGVVTNRSVQITVQGPTPGVGEIPYYLRFSNTDFLQGLLDTKPIDVLESLVFRSLNPNIPGQQRVVCDSVARRDIEMERELDRFECVIFQSSSGQEPVDFSLAELAAISIERMFPFTFVLFSVSDSGFCDFDQTTYEGDLYTWPESTVGTIVSFSNSCPSLTRECTENGWLTPNILTCETALIIQGVLNETIDEESYEMQVQVVASALATVEGDPNQQTIGLLQAISAFFERVVYAVNGSNETISPMVMGELVRTLSSIQQWPPGIIAQTDDSSRIIMSFEFIAGLFAQNISNVTVIPQTGVDFIFQNMSLSETQSSPLVSNVTIVVERGIIFVAEYVPLVVLQQVGRTVAFGSNQFIEGAAVFGRSLLPELSASIILPPSLFNNINDRDLVGLFFVLYTKPTLFPLRTYVQNNSSRVVGSSIIAATVGPGLEFDNLIERVEVNLRITVIDNNTIIREGSETCVSWDFDAAGGQGDWTTFGCTTVMSNNGVVTCRCNHLTNFAILVDICSRTNPDDCHDNDVIDDVLSAITYIGTSLSVIGLIVTIITLLIFKRLRVRDASKYHIQLSIAILAMLLVFVAGVERTDRYGGCVTVSVLIHYFSLAAVAWMCAEAILMFQKLVYVFKKVTKNTIIITSLVCWLAPLVPVIIPLIIDLASGTGPSNDLIIRRDEFCFLSNAIVFWVAFLGPIFAVISLNVVIYVIVIGVLIKHTRGTLVRKNETIDTKTVIRLMVSIVSVMFLFGLSWLFAALTITVSGVRTTFQILFAIFTSLQGFFIFFFFCVVSQEARESWKELLSCGRYKSKLLNPNLKFTSSATGERHKVNLSSREQASSAFPSKSAQNTAVSSRRILDSNLNSASGVENDHYSTEPGKEEKIELNGHGGASKPNDSEIEYTSETQSIDFNVEMDTEEQVEGKNHSQENDSEVISKV